MQRHVLEQDGAILRYGGVIELWRRPDDGFRRFFIELLQACAFRCFRFETPAVTRGTVGMPFEFVLVDSPVIDSPPDCRDFQGHFDRQSEEILVFDNLGGDATLVVPRPMPDGLGYAHIAGFTRCAPVRKQAALWQTVGETLQQRLGDRPLWLNTAGGGVPWLHVRLDSRPKYYVFEPYTRTGLRGRA